MPRKRRNTSSPEPDDSSETRPLNVSDDQDSWDDSDQEDGEEVPRVNQYSGQVGAFPGLANYDDELFYGPASDGVEYLRMVRSEAKGIPYILTASAERTRDEKIEAKAPMSPAEQGGYFYDGAYTATGGLSSPERHTIPLAQRHYHESLLTQFRLVQATMRCVPPLSKIQDLAPSQLISFPEDSRRARLRWESAILSHDPHPVQIACMDPATVLALVRLLKRRLHVFLQHEDDDVIRRVGAWAWAILGKCRERGELLSEDIGEIRGLARQAANVYQRRIGQLDCTDSDQESEEEIESDMDLTDQCDAHQKADTVGEEGDTEGEPKDTLRGTEILPNISYQGPDRARLVDMTLDMIITVVGEMYGQRDLLDLRPKWGAADEK